MRWNWEHDDWPEFTWEASRLDRAESTFLLGAGQIVGTVEHLPDADHELLTVEAMSNEALTTSEIEGEILDRPSVQSSIRRELGLATDHRRIKPAEKGIGELMVDLYRRFADPLDERTLFDWHRMMMRGRDDLHDLGRYRTHESPMQVVSGPIDKPKVHFEAPPSDRVPAEMKRFIAWFNRTAPHGRAPLPALTRAGIAHLYFESVHPFEDGNGRIGRAISEKVLAQSLGRPSLTALAATILAHRAEYYRELELTNDGLEITGWLAWFAGVAIEAQRRTLAQVEFLIDKTRLLDKFTPKLNERQLAVLVRVLREGPAGFKGGLSASNYVAIAKTSTATASRDLAAMVELGVMTRTGEHRGTRYHPAIPLRPVPRVRVDSAGHAHEAPPGKKGS